MKGTSQKTIKEQVMECVTFEELKDIYIGKVGTPSRDAYEESLKEDLLLCHIGQIIKQARLKQNLTKKELGEKMGVQPAQISKLENGRNPTFVTIAKAFRALGIPAELSAGSTKIALW